LGNRFGKLEPVTGKLPAGTWSSSSTAGTQPGEDVLAEAPGYSWEAGQAPGSRRRIRRRSCAAGGSGD
jgi:hypothetical protein